MLLSRAQGSSRAEETLCHKVALVNGVLMCLIEGVQVAVSEGGPSIRDGALVHHHVPRRKAFHAQRCG